MRSLFLLLVLRAGVVAAHGGHNHNHAAHDHVHDHHDHAHHDHDHHDHDHHDHAHHDHAHREGASKVKVGDYAAPAATAPTLRLYPATAVTLTMLSGGSSVLGGILVVCLGAPSPRLLGHLLSFASGIMLYVSYADLLPHAVAELSAWNDAHGEDAHAGHNHAHDDSHAGHSHGSGLYEANLWLLGGMGLFALMAACIPETHDHAEGGGMGDAHHHAAEGHETTLATPDVASSSSGSGVDKPTRRGRRVSKAGPLAPTAPPAPSPGGKGGGGVVGGFDKRRLLMTGVMAAMGITLHNLPEGLIVYNQTLGGLCTPTGPNGTFEPALPGTLASLLSLPRDLSSCLTRGLAVTLAIALHNIPEGMAVASPIYASTGSSTIALGWTLFSAAAEPAAAILFGYFFSHLLTPVLISRLNAGTAGVMIALCVGELMPTAAAAASPKAAVFSNLAGQVVMFASLHAMRSAGLH